eukprot:TRINITY_DN19808_c0_g1_i1.p1 TRINITY_DN19808_c0_g1~~TRINITY_DN19808_c0_g1_i1.p1  ORF type:complete len:373 (-),score=99.36 TRINITY_DN19808_c0_g1_i1:39-1157(-)
MAETVLVTGATGYIAGFVIRDLLAQGYNVRGTVRDLKNAESRVKHLRSVDGGKDRLTLYKADLSLDGSFDDAVEGCDYVIHMASPMDQRGNITDPIVSIVQPAVNGVVQVLKACNQSKSVKRIVLTSSILAVFWKSDERGPNHVFNEDDWNTTSTPDKHPYAYSKMQAEKAAWDYMKSESRHFDLVVINASGVFGPLLSSATRPETIAVIIGILQGWYPMLPNSNIPIVDVRDVAKAHVGVLKKKECGNQRYLVHSDVKKIWDLVPLLKRTIPVTGLFVIGIPNWMFQLVPNMKDEGIRYTQDNNTFTWKLDGTKITKDIGLSYIPTEKVFGDMGKSLFQLGILHPFHPLSKIAIVGGVMAVAMFIFVAFFR